MTTRNQIAEWFDYGVDNGMTWMVVLCDDFDHLDYPSYHNSDVTARIAAQDPGRMQRAMEVYKLDPAVKQWQLAQERCWALNVDWDKRQ